MTNLIDMHADDYGLSAHSDKTILSLLENNKLDSISFIPNFSRFNEAACELKNIQQTRSTPALISVHLNFVEGPCCAQKELLPDLVDNNGFFTVSWEQLFIWNFNPIVRSKIKRELKIEIIAQTEKLISSGIIEKVHLRFDSHMHTHMIPIVFDALQDAISEKEYEIEYIRNTEDPVHYYLSTPRLFRTYSPINIIKCFILNCFSCIKIKASLKKYNITPNLLCGVFFSGKMDKERVTATLPLFARKAVKAKRPLELLFHPCLMTNEELNEEFNKAAINQFHISQNRMIEYDAVNKILKT